MAISEVIKTANILTIFQQIFSLILSDSLGKSLVLSTILLDNLFVKITIRMIEYIIDCKHSYLRLEDWNGIPCNHS